MALYRGTFNYNKDDALTRELITRIHGSVVVINKYYIIRLPELTSFSEMTHNHALTTGVNGRNYP